MCRVGIYLFLWLLVVNVKIWHTRALIKLLLTTNCSNDSKITAIGKHFKVHNKIEFFFSLPETPFNFSRPSENEQRFQPEIRQPLDNITNINNLKNNLISSNIF